jgi:hypothetical protein
MLPPRRLLPLRAVLRTLPTGDSAALGTLILGAPGAGKTILLSLILLCHLIRGLPGLVLDPLGTLSDAFLFRLACFLSEYPPGDDEFFWQRLRYIPLGDESVVTHFPIYFQRHEESLWDASSRLITVLERANPQLTTSPLTWPAARRLALNAGMVLTALSLPLSEIEDLVFNPLAWQQSGRFAAAIRRNPQAKDAVSYFTNYYLLLPRSEQRRLAGTFLDQVFMLTADPTLRAIFSGSSTPGIDYEAVETKPQLVMINGKGITNPTSRSFAMQWIFEHLYPHLKARGRRKTPFVLMIDEFANLVNTGSADNKPLAELFDELLAQYARNNQVFVTLALQSLDQVPERLRQTLLRLATIISGRAGTLREAREIADHLFRKDIYRIHHHKKVFGKVDPPVFIRGVGYRPAESLSQDKQRSEYYPYYILDYDPQYMALELQAEDAAGRIQQLGALEFLCRPVVSEGAVSQDVVSLALSDAITDPDTGEGIFPDPEQDAALLAQIQHQLAARSGIPVTDILQEQEARLTDGISQKPPQTQLATAAGERLPFTPPNGRQPEQRTAKRTPSLPTLDEHQNQFLAFVSSNPGTLVATVYKELGIRPELGTRIREHLKAQGLVRELDISTASARGGRPSKCVIPTLAGLELMGLEPPPGRGGSVHRYIQEQVVQGARAKGYSATIEYQLATGAIVDVHLEKGAGLRRIAVEIAIVSTVEREITHLRHSLAAQYDQIFTLFGDEQLLAKVASAIQTALSSDEQRKVRLLPLRQLAYIG